MQTSKVTGGSRALAIEKLAGAKGALSVESWSFEKGQPIPNAFSEYGRRQSPELHWRGVPDLAASLVVVMEDPDAPTPEPFSHWVLYNLPPTARGVPPAVPPGAWLPQFGGASQGRTTAGVVGYFGPRPPRNDGRHHYHFEVFALDRTLDVGPGADRDDVLQAMQGHVLASGEIVGTYEAPSADR